MQPIRFADFVQLMQAQDDEKMTPAAQVTLLVESLSRIITSVDEITDNALIIDWLRHIKPGHLNKLNEQMEDTVSWGPDFKYKINCKDCGMAQEVVAPLNPLAFFT